MKIQFIGFKGKNNSSYAFVKGLTDEGYFLTNSFQGLEKDIMQLQTDVDIVCMFGLDKQLSNEVKIEQSAMLEDKLYYSQLELDRIFCHLERLGLKYIISDNPTSSLCNAAYWHTLQKFNGNALFIHIPTNKNMSTDFMDKLRSALHQSLPCTKGGGSPQGDSEGL